MTKKQYLSLVILNGVLIMIFLGAIFYWFSIRPYNIKQNCYLEADNKTDKFIEDNDDLSVTKVKEVYGLTFERCLNKNGI